MPQEGHLEGSVVGAPDSKPIAGARVLLCRVETREQTAIENPFSACQDEIASTSTDELGRFRLTWQPSLGRVGARVLITSTGWLPWTGEPSALRSGRELAVALRRAPTVEITVVGRDAKPIERAGGGWVVEAKNGIQARYEVCCTNEDGILSFTLDGVPEGPVLVFAVAGEPPARFGSKALSTVAGEHYTSVVTVDRPLQRVMGRVVDAPGAPLAALVSVTPAPNTTFSALDRVLLAAQDEGTDMHGGFARYLTRPTRAVLELRAWTGLRKGTPHVATERVSAIETQFEKHPHEVVLHAPTAPVVRCTVVGPDGDALALSALGILFVPHRSDGHSGRCFWAGGPPRADADEQRRAAREVRFIWPRSAESLLVMGQGKAATDAPAYVGEVKLEHAADRCQILAK
jgi:hypothetical protein